MREVPSRLYLNVFRFVLLVRLGFQVAAALFVAFVWRTIPPTLFISGTATVGTLIYLSIPGLPRKMGQFYALAPASVIISLLLVEQQIHIYQVHIGASEAPWATVLPNVHTSIVNFQLALVVLVAWACVWRRTLLYCVYVLALHSVLIILTFHDSPAFLLGELRESSMAFFTSAVVSFVVGQLVRVQNRQNAEIESAHQQLAEYASTLEKLAISRERNRLARELHDTLAHTLSAATVKLNATNIVWDSNVHRAREMLGEVIVMMNDGMVEVRRALRDLRSTPLEDMGLLLAVRSLAESAAERATLRLDLRLPATFERLLPNDEQGIYRVIQEALENVVRHAEANNVSLHVVHKDNMYHIDVCDDGRGFDTLQTHSQSHFGLNGMLQRVVMMRGKLDITSAPGKGTKVAFTVEQRA